MSTSTRKAIASVASARESISEHAIQAQILDWLKIKGIFHWRNNTGSSGPMFYGGKRRFVRFGVAGAPDIFAIVQGELFGIEVKAPGKKISDKQVEFRDAMLNSGANYIMADSLDCVTLVLDS